MSEVKRLQTYADTIQMRMISAAPEKHKTREKDYREWLKREFDFIMKKISTYETKDPRGGKL